MESYKKTNTSNGYILMLLLALTVASQFDGSTFEGTAKTVMYLMWCIVFLLYSFTLKCVDRTRYVLTGAAIIGVFVLQYAVAGIVIDNYNPPIIFPFITSFLFYIVGILFYRMGLTEMDLQKALRIYCIMCFCLGLYIWFTHYGNLSNWFEIDQNLYNKKNSAGQILAVGAIISCYYLKSKSSLGKLINITIAIGLTFIIMIIHCRTALIALFVAILIPLFMMTNKRQRIVIILSIPLICLLAINIPFIQELINKALYIDKFTATGEFTLNAFLSNRLDWFSAAFANFNQSIATILLGVGRSYVDNLFINVLTSSGIVGLIAILITYIERFALNLKFQSTNDEYKLLKIMSIFYIVESFAEGLPPYGPGACSVIFWFISGYCDVMYKEEM